jgi:eukaryotic-like serine/threonine-protein kinase
MSPERWQQLARLFDEALELEPKRRTAFLAEACAGDEALRREVETLLAARERAGEFLQRDAFEDEAARLAAHSPTLQPGQTIAHFEVQGLLGAGAMGEVYRARDTRLDRQVALKLLPARFLQDAGRLRRFAREARAVSALNHPNIITVFDIGQDNGRPFIAAEYVVGETLRERLTHGPLSFAEAAAIAQQIGAALAAAHEAGIVHRDIKPENVMVRADGVVKVLDFGIAKLLARDEGERLRDEKSVGSRLHPSSLLAHPSTEQGTVIGTPGYMSPEQARGLAVDARTDIFSLGVVLYEMLAGRAPFCGATNADIIVALLEREPEPLSEMVPNVALDEFMRKALAKDATQRYQSVIELLEALKTNTSGTQAKKSKSAGSKRLGKQVLLSVALLGLVGTLAWQFWQRQRERSEWSDRTRLRFATLYSTRLGMGGAVSRPAFAPIGRRVAFSQTENGRSRILVAGLDGKVETTLAEGEAKLTDPVWSPDGRRLAFLAQEGTRHTLKTIALTGGAQTVLKSFETQVETLLAWRQDRRGERFYYEAGHNLHAFDPATGRVEAVTHFAEQGSTAHSFDFSPETERLVYLETRPDGYYLLWQRLGGAPHVLEKSSGPYLAPTWFPDGRRIAYLSNQTGSYQVFVRWLDSASAEQLTFDNEDYSDLAIAADGQAILANALRENSNIFAWDFNTGSETEHTSEFGMQFRAEPAPDGERLLFQGVSNLINGIEAVFVKPLKPGGQALKLASEAFNARWSPDGTAVSYVHGTPGKNELWIAPAAGGQTRRLAEMTPSGFLPMPFVAQHQDHDWSSDSTRIAYSSRRAGLSNVWTVTRDGVQETQLTSNAEVRMTLSAPRWSPDGQRLAYLSWTRAPKPQPSMRGVWLYEAGQSRLLFQVPTPLQLIGWVAGGRELLIANGTLDSWSTPQAGELFSLRPDTNTKTRLRPLETCYLPSLRLTRDGRQLALITRTRNQDNLAVMTLPTGTLKRLTQNADPTTFYASPAWAADGQHLFYNKQTRWTFVHLIEKRF